MGRIAVLFAWAFAAALLAAGCGSEPSKPKPLSQPVVISVSPERASNTDTASVVIRGTGFLSGATALIGIHAIEQTVLVSSEEIRGVVPAGITPSLYGVRVRNRDGGTGVLPFAFRVTGPGMSHSGDVAEDEVWLFRDSPHVVSGEVHVRGSSRPVLTIEPGCRVLFQNGARLTVADGAPGMLVADGTSGSIEFTTSLQPGGEVRGSWGGLALFGDSCAVLRNCRLRFGGGPTIGGLPQSLLMLSGAASAVVERCTFEQSAAAGIYVDDPSSFVSFTGCSFRQNSGPHLSLGLEKSAVLNANHVFEDGAIELRSGTMPGDLEWPGTAAAYRIGFDLVVHGMLTLDPGVTLEFAPGTTLIVGLDAPGGLVAAGEEGKPVRLRPEGGSAGPGTWGGIHFGASLLAGSRLDHVELIDAGGAGQPAALVCDGGAPRIQDTRIEASGSMGLIYRAGSRPSGFARNVITGCTGRAIELTAAGVGGLDASNSFSGNGVAGLLVDGAVVTESALWNAFGFSSPYVIRGDVEIRSASRPIVTVAPGATLSFQQGCGLFVGSSEGTNESGALVVERGNESTLLTSVPRSGLPQSPGDWDGVVFLETSDDAVSRLDGCVVEYGGAGALGNVRCRDASPVLRDLLLQWSAGYGLYLEGVSAPDTSGVSYQFNTLGTVGP